MTNIHVINQHTSVIMNMYGTSRKNDSLKRKVFSAIVTIAAFFLV